MTCGVGMAWLQETGFRNMRWAHSTKGLLVLLCNIFWWSTPRCAPLLILLQRLRNRHTDWSLDSTRGRLGWSSLSR